MVTAFNLTTLNKQLSDELTGFKQKDRILGKLTGRISNLKQQLERSEQDVDDESAIKP